MPLLRLLLLLFCAPSLSNFVVVVVHILDGTDFADLFFVVGMVGVYERALGVSASHVAAAVVGCGGGVQHNNSSTMVFVAALVIEASLL